MPILLIKHYCISVTYGRLTGFQEEDYDGSRCLQVLSLLISINKTLKAILFLWGNAGTFHTIEPMYTIFQSETSFSFLALAELKTCNFQSRVG